MIAYDNPKHSPQVPYMIELSPFLVDFGILICLISKLFQLIKLELPCYSSILVIKVELLDGPVCTVFKLHWQMTSFPKHKAIRTHVKRRFFLQCKLFFFKQKTAYEMVSCDWSSDVCSSDLNHPGACDQYLDGHRNHRHAEFQIGRASCRERV